MPAGHRSRGIRGCGRCISRERGPRGGPGLKRDARPPGFVWGVCRLSVGRVRCGDGPLSPFAEMLIWDRGASTLGPGGGVIAGEAASPGVAAVNLVRPLLQARRDTALDCFREGQAEL